LRGLSSLTDEPAAPNPWEKFLPPDALPVRKIPAERGMNRWVWNLRLADAFLLDGTMLWGDASGPIVPPGTYQVRLRAGEREAIRSFEVLADPRLGAGEDALQAQFELASLAWSSLTECHRAAERIGEIRKQVAGLTDRLEQAGLGADVGKAARPLTEKLDAIEDRLRQTSVESNQDVLNFPPRLDAQLVALLGAVESADGEPTAGARERFADLRAELDRQLAELDAVAAADLERFNDLVRQTGAPPVLVPQRRDGAKR
jgi:hypothetical protein